MAIISLDKTNLANVGVPGSFSAFLGIDLDGTFKKVDSTGAITQIGAEFVVNSTRASILTLISNSQLSPGSVYSFTTGTECYSEGIEVYIPAISSSSLSTRGFGKFYNPIYTDLTIDVGGGIFNPNTSYAIGATAIWGGYYWINTTGNAGYSDDILTLNNTDWTQVSYNSNDYRVVYDEIEYDIVNDKFLSRKDKNNNFVSGVLDWSTTLVLGSEFDKNPIRYFKWGTEIIQDNSFLADVTGVFDCYVENSMLLNINDRLTSMSGLKLYNRSYQKSITTSGDSYQRNIILNDGNQINIYLEDSFQRDILIKNSQQYDSYFYNSYQNKLELINSSYQDNITLTNSSYQENIRLDNSYQSSVLIDNTHQSDLDFISSHQNNVSIYGDGSANIGQTNIKLSDSYQQYIYIYGTSGYEAEQKNLEINGNSYQEYITLTASKQENILLDKVSHQSVVSMDQLSYQRRITIDNNSNQGNLVMKSSGQQNILLNNNCSQYNLTLESSSSEYNIIISNESSINNILFNNAFFVDLELNNNSDIGNGYLSNNTSLEYTKLNKGILNYFTFSASAFTENEINNSSISNLILSNSTLEFTKLEKNSSINELSLTGSNISYNHLEYTTLSNQFLDSRSIEFQSLSSLKQRIETYNISCITASVTTDPYWLTLSDSNFFVLDIQTNTELGLTAVTTNGGLSNASGYGVVLKISNNSYSVGFTGGTILWNNGTPPSLTTGGIDFLVFLTHDYGQTWHGNMALTNLS